MHADQTSTSSLIELKAELLKKRQEYERQKQDAVAGVGRKPRPVAKLAPSPAPRETTIHPTVDDALLEKSRAALETKTRLYNRLQRGTMQEADLSAAQREGMMVDFTWKGWNPETNDFDIECREGDEDGWEVREGSHDPHDPHDPHGMGRLTTEQVLSLPEGRMDDWIEYEDEFGRTRMVRPRELQRLLAERAEAHHLLPSNPPRERPTTIHYDGQHEIRNKGVGFFQFAYEEEERVRQMSELRRLRTETLESRTRALLMREQRRMRVERRLARVRERRAAAAATATKTHETDEASTNHVE